MNDLHNDIGKEIKQGFDAIKAPVSSKQKALACSCLPRGIHVAQKRKFRFAPAAAAALLILVMACVGSYSVYSTETAYISIDINPSVEFGLNRFDTVVSVTAYNDDASTILETADLTHKNYKDALKLLLEDKAFSEYLQKDSNLALTVVTDDTKKEKALLLGVRSCTNHTAAQTECHGAGTSLRSEAVQNGMSSGKYMAYLALKELDGSVTVEDCHSMSMEEINDSIKRHCGDQQNSPAGSSNYPDDSNPGRNNGQGHGNGHGGGSGHHGHE